MEVLILDKYIFFSVVEIYIVDVNGTTLPSINISNGVTSGTSYKAYIDG